MGISLYTHKILWARSGGKCAICKRDLIIDPLHAIDDPSIVGDEAHIVAKEETFTRGDYDSLSSEERDSYSNLILLCKVHHKLIDDQPGNFTVEKLTEIKAIHEAEIKALWTDADEKKQSDDLIYASYIETWCKLAHIDDWGNISLSIATDDSPSIYRFIYDDWIALLDWTIGRIWLKRYPQLEASLINFAHVLQDMTNTLSKHLEFHDNPLEKLRTVKYYKIDEWNPERYDLFLKDYLEHTRLVSDLFFELTRAANYVCDRVRESLFPYYRIAEGLLLVSRDNICGLKSVRYRSEYREAERTASPYPGLDQFLKIRSKRDFSLSQE